MSASAVSVPKRRHLVPAAAAWMMGVFGVCYLFLPALALISGANMGLIFNLPLSILAFSVMLPLTLVAIAVFNPRVEIPRDGSMQPGPVLSAALGSLSLWAVLHSVVPLLRPLYVMSGPELASMIVINGVESLLFGMMLASFVRTRGQAFVLGAAFQATFVGIWFLVVGSLFG